MTLLPWFRKQAVTLWSAEGAVLDAEVKGRVFFVDSAPVLLQNIDVVNGRVVGFGQGGGCGWVQQLGISEALLRVRGGRFTNCSITGVNGGGINVISGNVEISDTSFARTRAEAVGNLAYGGGVGAFLDGTMILDRVRFINTSAASNLFMAFGGNSFRSKPNPRCALPRADDVR